MHLVAALAAGIDGAENGTAEIYLRGTATRATYYLDFEGITYIATGDDFILDSHGGGILYVDELCTVVVKTLGGAILRSFVAGAASSAVEVISDSFTGTDYTTASSGLSKPTTLKSVLDRWININGGPDWQVDIPGVGSFPIGPAIAGSFGLVFNVKAEGARGDGVANDTNAINSAIAAAADAGGGIVYFPPGTYRTTGQHNHPNFGDVSVIGAGPNATAIVLDNAIAAQVFATDAPTIAGAQLIANLRIEAAVTSASSILTLGSGSNPILYNVRLDATKFSLPAVTAASSGVTEIVFSACHFLVSPNAVFFSAPSILRRAFIHDCIVQMPVTFSPNVVLSCNQMDIRSCVFRNSNTTTGTYSCIRALDPNFNLIVTGCHFPGSAGALVTAIDIETYDNTATLYETNNNFGGGVRAYDYTVTPAAKGAQIHLGSRELRTIYITDNSAAPNLPLHDYGVVVLTSTATAIVFGTAVRPPDGARGTVVIYRPSGAAGTAQAGANFLNAASIPTAALQANIWEYRVCTPNATVRMALTVDGRSLGNAI